ncbi:VOC family protein [Acidocella sp. MX-AZ03]|uniref:VOC family protein n=1 Tax=Acidocella sp. MX-AZ03 TaxID=2697363 RepID=UPI0022DD987D|nr:VOC family protein [Acidocella sp. MX-AZ03]WBO60433.1 VOC family protein [Acidocella sp. MX-AZ03]
MLRETVYGAADTDTIEAVAKEMARDREVTWHADGSIGFYDDLGFALRICLATRKTLEVPAEVMPNVPNSTQSRGLNVIGVTPGAPAARPRTLSHVVYFVPDVALAEAFYTQRLGFRCTDRFTDVGPFLRPAGMADHHALFLIQSPPHIKGIEHFAFHMASPSQVLAAGTQMVKRGFQSFWGPGGIISAATGSGISIARWAATPNSTRTWTSMTIIGCRAPRRWGRKPARLICSSSVRNGRPAGRRQMPARPAEHDGALPYFRDSG